MNNKEKQDFIKKKIVDALFVCMEQKEISDMKADEIAKEADVSKRTLYKYYSSKKEMYLAVVKEAFKNLSENIQSKMEEITEKDPWYKIACVGREYMKYCFYSRTKAKLILGYDEMNYMDEYEDWVLDIQQYSNKFELVPFIKDYYKYHGIVPNTSVESLALYLWAEAQGICSLILNKSEWIKSYYKIDFEQLIEKHLQLSKEILGVKK